MKLPQRVAQHISESDSFKLFLEKMPGSWIIRQVTERDYGVDCYLELVNENNELTGELALIQLKSRKEIVWNNNDEFTISDIAISTSNYLFKFQVPVFIFVADVKNQALYFVSVGYYIRRNFADFVKQGSFSYRIKKMNLFEGADGIFHFKFDFYYDYLRSQFENEMIFFISNIHHHKDFFSIHWHADVFIGVEIDQLIVVDSIYRNYHFLSNYLALDWNIPSLREYKNLSREKFGQDYELYEGDLAALVAKLDGKLSIILLNLKNFLEGEMSYWKNVNPTLYEFVRKLDDKGKIYGF